MNVFRNKKMVSQQTIEAILLSGNSWVRAFPVYYDMMLCVDFDLKIVTWSRFHSISFIIFHQERASNTPCTHINTDFQVKCTMRCIVMVIAVHM